MSEGIDRRAFIAGAAGIALAGCGSAGGHGQTGHRSTPAAKQPRVPSMSRKTAPPPRPPRRLEHAIRGPVIERGAPAFADAAQVYNEVFDSVLPRAVARPLDAHDVAAAVRWAVAYDVPIRARSGGHSYAGYSTVADGVVLDLRSLRGLAVDRRSETAAIGAGTQLLDVYTGLAGAGATIPAGSCPSVGLGGHATGGGMGLAGRAFGLTTDHIVAAEVVTADGRIRNVENGTDRDLLWAIRGGGGGNFGVITRLHLRVRRLPRSASWFFVWWPWSAASQALDSWLRWAPHAPDAVTSIFHLETGPQALLAGQYLGPAADLGRLLAPMTSIPGAQPSTGDQDYLGLQVRWAGCLHQSPASCHTVGTRPGGTLQRASFLAASDYLTQPLSSAARQVLIGAIERRRSEPGSAAILFDAYGGAINRVSPHATAFVHRNTLCCMQYLTYGGGAQWLAAAHAAMRPYVSGMAYQNYIDPSLQTWRRAYYGASYERLKDIRHRVDPDHKFNFPQAIGR